MALFDHDGIRFHFETIGEGPGIVFTHGLGGDMLQTKDLMGEVAGHRVLFWDCRGHGETEPVGPPEKFSFAQLAEDLGALLDHVGMKQTVVGGISMGAGISTAFAVRRPERVRALVLVRPAWVDQPTPENLKWLPQVTQLLEKAGPDGDMSRCRSLPEFAPFRDLSAELMEGLEGQLAKPKAHERRERLARMTRSCPITSWSEVEALTMPALVVGNEPDATHPIAMAEEWARRLPNARLAMIPAKSDMDAHRAGFRMHFQKLLEEIEGEVGA
ncbi:MAG: alpha/beta hydrolase [Candidatus Omnitrophica bacterium]|nr:3-oxoadipate enol-lactonase 2 [bacterium]NUN96560.1 alpha/beta hydrolase [Candidatus Omnitrophota bacterium]